MITAAVPKIKTLFVRPFNCSAGMPNPTSKITNNIGIPRKTSTYIVASRRKGVKAGAFEVLIRAIDKPKIATQIVAITVKVIFVTNPNRILGKTSTPYAHLKKASDRDFQPGEVTATIAKVPKTKVLESAAINAFLRFFLALARRRETSNSLGCQVPPKSYS